MTLNQISVKSEYADGIGIEWNDNLNCITCANCMESCADPFADVGSLLQRGLHGIGIVGSAEFNDTLR